MIFCISIFNVVFKYVQSSMAQTQRDFDALAIRELGACHDDGSWLWQPPAVSGAKPARRKAVVCKRARSDTSDDCSPLRYLVNFGN